MFQYLDTLLKVWWGRYFLPEFHQTKFIACQGKEVIY